MNETKKHVLWVTHWLPSPAKPGRGIFILEQALAFQASGGNVVILSVQFAPGGLLKTEWRRYTEAELPVLELSIKSFASKILQLWPALWIPFLMNKIQRKIRLVFPDISAVHSQVILPAGIIGSALAEKLRLPHYLTEHWSKAPDFWGAKLYPLSRPSAMRALKRIEKISVVSDFSRQELLKVLPIGAPDIAIIPNVVHRPVNLKAQDFIEKPEQQLKLLAVASWNRANNITKRPDILIDSLKILAQRYPQRIHISIVGNGNLLPEMTNSLKKMSLTYSALGFIPKDRLALLYRKHHLLVHASNIETFSLVVAEALANGLPVVASKVGAIPELFQNQHSGLLVANQVEAFVEAIESLWQNYPNDRLALAQNQQKNFAPEHIGSEISNFYK